MCGITGVFAFNEVGRFSMMNLPTATDYLAKRGPDFGDTYLSYFVGLGHRRLSVIDTSEAANQPFSDTSGRYTIVFNGEIYNFATLKKQLEIEKNQVFCSDSDTEVLLYLYIHYGSYCLELLHGFFAFAIYDNEENSLFVARDRFGVKPLLYYIDEDRFLFSSEMKSLIQYGIIKEISTVALRHYLHLHYIPAPYTIFKNIYKLMPGHFLKVQNGQISAKEAFYILPKNYEQHPTRLGYEAQKEHLLELMQKSVSKRMVADVPLGAFLSGGVDSSVLVGLASRQKADLQTFSIGYYDKFFDETPYAETVAKHFATKHTTFKLSQKDTYECLFDVLDYIDEPFADSSALPVYLLSKYVRKYMTVALSGDGADEMLGGYNKHWGEYQLRKGGWKSDIVKALLPFWKSFPKSRNSSFFNKVRQLERFAEGSKLSPAERYWTWAGFTQNDEVSRLLSKNLREQDTQDYLLSKQEILKDLKNNELDGLNEVFYTDMQLVLSGDMLFKVDMMSMANGLEVREPFLDHEVVNFIFSLPVSSKIDTNIRKKILQDTFKDMLPSSIYNRPKHGFEVPLLGWLRTELRSLIENDLLQDRFVEEQGIFEVEEVRKLKQQLFSDNPADSPARIWALVVFQYWWKKYLGFQKLP